MKAGIYVRISRDPLNTEAGVKRQEKECRVLAEQRGWEVAEVFRENDVSAFTGKRPVWQHMLGALDAGQIDVVIGWANDRLYRRVRDQLDLMERATKIVTVKDGDVDPKTAEGKMRMTILASVAEFESGRKSERHLAKHAQMAEDGSWPGGRPPFGYKQSGASLAVVPKEAEKLREAAAALLDGETLRSVSDRMGMNTRTVWRRLKNPAIVGQRVHHGEMLKASWPPILDRRTWQRINKLLDDPARGPKGPRPRYLLTGLVFCGTCGGPLGGHRQAYGASYACASSDCPRPRVRAKAEDLDALVTTLAAERTVATTRVSDPNISQELHEELAAIEDQMFAWARNAAGAGISPDEIRAGREPMVERRTEVERLLEQRSMIVEFVDEHGALRADINATAALRSARSQPRHRDLRASLEVKVEKIVLRDSGRNRYCPLSERVDITWRG